MINLRVLLLLLVPVLCGAQCETKFSETYLAMLTSEKRMIQFIINSPIPLQNQTFTFIAEHKNNLAVTPNFTVIKDNATTIVIEIEVDALKAGETNIFANSSIPGYKSPFVNVQVYKNQFIEILSIIIGWTYFFAWSISFYPQAYENYKRRSVVGLNFDFVVVNITGYVLYSMFNLGLCYIPAIRKQYEEKYPYSIVSVFMNDIVFGLHAFAITAFTGLQCLWYETGGQKISWFGKGFHYVSALILAVSAVLCFTDYLLWLDFLYICSYIKLSVTFCKYGPQAIMNYKRKSTDGWSIETVLLDIAGGICSVLQMFMNAYNYDKWAWILENPTKLWLGVFSLLFDFFFVFQHYCLYNHKNDTKRRQDTIDAEINLNLSEKECLQLTEAELLKLTDNHIKV